MVAERIAPPLLDELFTGGMQRVIVAPWEFRAAARSSVVKHIDGHDLPDSKAQKKRVLMDSEVMRQQASVRSGAGKGGLTEKAEHAFGTIEHHPVIGTHVVKRAIAIDPASGG